VFSKGMMIIMGGFLGLTLVEIGLRIPEVEHHEVVALYQQPIPDEELGARLAPYAGGHDAKGFRNDAVPEQVEIVAIGDSQTWGVNARRSEAWPQTLAKISGRSVYNMGLGYYGPVQYWVLVDEALELSPKVIIVSLYFGNDIWGAYQMIYHREQHAQFRLNSAPQELFQKTIDFQAQALWAENTQFASQLQFSSLAVWNKWLIDHLAIARLLDQRGWWPGNTIADKFYLDQAWAEAFPEHGDVYDNGEVRTVFSTAYRLLALDLNRPEIVEGLRITQEMLKLIKTKADETDVKLLVLLIPTKELVYAEAMQAQYGQLSPTYTAVTDMETQVHAKMLDFCKKSDLNCVDALPVLKAAVDGNEQLYPATIDDHLLPRGYFLLASAINKVLSQQNW
jgi:lysophospholipase L1-like esterase